MRKVAWTALILAGLTSTAFAQYRTYTYGGYGTGSNPRSTYVAPSFNSHGFTSGHYRTTPNNTQRDNFGTRGNYNPYSNNYGTKIPRY